MNRFHRLGAGPLEEFGAEARFSIVLEEKPFQSRKHFT